MLKPKYDSALVPLNNPQRIDTRCAGLQIFYKEFPYSGNKWYNESLDGTVLFIVELTPWLFAMRQTWAGRQKHF